MEFFLKTSPEMVTGYNHVTLKEQGKLSANICQELAIQNGENLSHFHQSNLPITLRVRCMSSQQKVQ